MNKYIYHITEGYTLQLAFEQNVFPPGPFAVNSFVHCSLKKQVIPVLHRFYSDRVDLILLKINTTLLKPPVVYENLEGGRELFPHVYGLINLDAIQAITRLTKEKSNAYVFPSFRKKNLIIR